jgi:hypothetical protein
VDLDVLLLEAGPDVLDEAYSSLHRSHVTHYEQAGEAFTRQALADLFALVLTSIRTRNLAAMSAYSDEVAVERFNHGYDISEVQMAYNSLEEAMWRRGLWEGRRGAQVPLPGFQAACPLARPQGVVRGCELLTFCQAVCRLDGGFFAAVASVGVPDGSSGTP